MQNNNNSLDIQTNWKEDLEKLGSDLFSYPVESMEIADVPADYIWGKNPKDTLLWYLREMHFESSTPINLVTIKVRFTGLDYDFLIPIEIDLVTPQHLNQQLINKIESTNDVSLCNLMFFMSRSTKVINAAGESFSYYLSSATKDRIEFSSTWRENKRQLKSLLAFNQKVRECFNTHKEIAKDICGWYAEVCKLLLNSNAMHIEDIQQYIHEEYPDMHDWAITHIIQNFENLQKKNKNIKDKKTDKNQGYIALEENDTLLFNNAYKDQWSDLYNNVLKWGEYSELYWWEMDLLKQNTEKLKKYMWALHIWFGCWDMSKEVQIYKQLLWIEYMDDKNRFWPLDDKNKEIDAFRKSHCFVGVDTADAYKNNLTYFLDMWFWMAYDTSKKYFFDQNNCFFVNDDIYTFLKKKKLSTRIDGTNKKMIPEQFHSASFDILWNTLLNFDEDEKIKLIDSFMTHLWDTVTWFVSIHKKADTTRLLGMYNTPQERLRLQNLIKSNYHVEREHDGEINYDFDFSVNEAWSVLIKIKLLKDVCFVVWDHEIKKHKGCMLTIWESEKFSDMEFEELVQKTEYAKIIDTMDGPNWTKIYVLWNKNASIPLAWLWNFETTFDENYWEQTRKEIDKLSDMLRQLSSKDFQHLYCRSKIKEELNEWHITMVSPTFYDKQYNKMRIQITLKYKKEWNQTIVDMSQENPRMIDIRYTYERPIDRQNCFHSYVTLTQDKENNTYTMWIDNDTLPQLNDKHHLAVNKEIEEKILTLSKSLLVHTIGDYCL